eukprot:GHVH01007685.1.p1 GENE.GHVH01007685.1~~GHVH01007685.1.p1  ORF type:complete len:151 (-),score=8.78 GHVH01007685.1:12-464(-)
MASAKRHIGFPLMILCTWLCSAAFGFTLFNDTTAFYFSIAFYVLSLSISVMARHVIAEMLFPQRHVVKISAAATIISHVVCFLNIWFQYSDTAVNTIMIVFTAALFTFSCIPMYFFMYISTSHHPSLSSCKAQPPLDLSFSLCSLIQIPL